ncbi:MAG: fumarylacetoacetate hydrolase family protein [Xanthomonadales bacterium]|nr:fumarylacetoacetate hydrolase family protein [Xanthomonadales bacterium]
MRLVSYTRNGQPGFGMLRDGGVIQAQTRTEFNSLGHALRAGGLRELAALAENEPDFSLDQVTLEPPVVHPGKILCVGINYKAHIAETGREPPRHPWIFVRFPDSVVGHGQPMLRPSVSDKYDFEGELAVIIGRRAHRVERTRAMDFVAGFSCFNDGSVRNYQRHSPLFTAGKNFHRSGAFGPWLVTADEAPSPAEMKLETRLNGEVMQSAPVSDLCFDIPYLIEYCSTFAVLEPGDVIVTGTPGGVGFARTPPLWMQPGDRIEVDISGVGCLSNPVEQEALA